MLRSRCETHFTASRRYRCHTRTRLHRPTHATGIQSPRNWPVYPLWSFHSCLWYRSLARAYRIDEQGLRSLLAPYTEGRGADAVIITVAGERPFLQAIAGVCKGGTIHIFAAHSAIVPVNLEHIYQQELGITSTYSSSPEELRIALDLLNSRAVRVDGLISHHLPLEQFAEAVTLMRQRAALKVYFQIAGES
ncbi:MAG: zinc-binding dehydrogenase [Chloroflexi bacterium]|nr:MAG: zinc-binding dehydrogenase [Chloroflexota bacterium]